MKGEDRNRVSGRGVEVGGDSSAGEAACPASDGKGSANREDAIASGQDDPSGGPSVAEVCRQGKDEPAGRAGKFSVSDSVLRFALRAPLRNESPTENQGRS